MTGRAATAASWSLADDVSPERAGATLVELIHQQAVLSPDAPAVSDGHESWSYRRLWDRTSAVAAHLTQLGVGRGTAVGVSVTRTNSAVAALLGVLVSGAAYVPLDPDYPPERLRAMSARIDLPVVVRNAGAPVAPLEGARVVDVDELAPASRSWCGPWPEPNDPAYVLFTSGSSGAPKGVRITHANLSSFLTWIRDAFDPAELALVAATTSFNFDPSVIEVYGTLISGGAMRLLPNALALADHSVPVTLLSAPPSVIAELVRAGRYPPTARTLLMGGEALPPRLANDLLAAGTVDRLLNCYGPTETTVMVTVEEVRVPLEGPVSIGRPIGENQLLVLDDDGRPVPDGQVGQLWIAGPQVAEGYVGDDAQVTSGFDPAPAASTQVDHARALAYRTGDLASLRPDGRLDFHGRADEQLKIRGFRVEPGDIERALVAQPGIVQAAVVSTGSGGHARLVGYYVPAGAAPAAADLRDALRLVLPPYLVPSELVAVPQLTVTPTGKLDRRSLAADATRRHAPGGPGSGATVTGVTSGPGLRAGGGAGLELEPTQELVLRLVAEILDPVGPIDLDDDFLDDLGGTSLAMVRLLSRLEEELDCRLSVGRLLADTSLRGLASLAATEREGSQGDELLWVNPAGTRPPLFLIHAYLGSVLRYRRLGPWLDPDQPLVGIHVHDLEGDTTSPVSMEELARRAVDRVRAVRPEGPYLLGGHSAGGLVAYEAARLLRAAGHQVRTVLLIDTPARLSLPHYYWGEVMLNWPELRSASTSERIEALRAVVASRLSLRRAATAPDRLDVAVERAGRLSNLAVRNHITGDYAGDVVVLRTRQGVRMSYGDRTLGWGRLVRGEITTVAVPGDHNTLFDPPYLDALAEAIARVVHDLSTDRAGSRAVPRRNAIEPTHPVRTHPPGGPAVPRPSSSSSSTLDLIDLTDLTSPPPTVRQADLPEELERLLGGRHPRPKLLLFGNYGHGNLGDEAILTSLLELLRPLAEVTVVSRRPERIERDHRVAAAGMLTRQGLTCLLRADIVAIGGGGIFGNGMKGLTSLLPTVALVAQRLGKETVFLAIGAYTSAPLWVQTSLRRAAAGSSLVTARDLESVEVLGPGPNTVQVDDPALTLEPAPANVALDLLHLEPGEPRPPLLGVSMKPTRFAGRNEKQVAVMSECIDWWQAHTGGDAVILCLSDRGDNGIGDTCSDVSMAEEVKRRVDEPDHVRTVGPAITPAAMKAVIAQLDAVIGHRLHSQMFAWSVGTPMAGISYERKADAFLEAVHAKRFDLWGVEAEPVIEWLRSCTDRLGVEPR